MSEDTVINAKKRLWRLNWSIGTSRTRDTCTTNAVSDKTVQGSDGDHDMRSPYKLVRFSFLSIRLLKLIIMRMGVRRIFSRDGQIRGLGTKVPQRGPRDGAPVGVWGQSRRQVVKIMHK